MHALRRIPAKAKDIIFPLTSGLKPKRFTDLIHGHEKLQMRFEDWDKDLGAGGFVGLALVSALCQLKKPKKIFEIGTGLGRTTFHMALNAPDDCIVTTLDITDHPRMGEIFKNKPEASKIQQIIADSTKYDFSPLEKSIDFVFVDGCHYYKEAKNDSLIALKIVKPGGIVLWDDYCPNWPGVVQAIREIKQEKQIDIFRVPEAGFAFYQA